MATILRANGERDELVGEGPRNTLTLEQIQRAVGGYFEVLPLDGSKMLLANEDGFSMGLGVNVEASELFGQCLVGDVVLCDRSELE